MTLRRSTLLHVRGAQGQGGGKAGLHQGAARRTGGDAARADRVRRVRQRRWQHLHPQSGEEGRSARQYEYLYLFEREPVLDLRPERILEAAGLLARLAADESLGDSP